MLRGGRCLRVRESRPQQHSEKCCAAVGAGFNVQLLGEESESAVPLPCLCVRRLHDGLAEAFHLLELRTELEEQEVDARALKLADAISHLLGCSCQSGA